LALSPVNEELIRAYLDKHGADESSDFYIKYSNGSPGLALKAFEDDLIARRDELWKIYAEFIKTPVLPKIIEVLKRRYQWPRYDDVRNDFDISEKILRDIYIAKLGLDKRLVNIDIKDKIIKCVRSAPITEVIQKWFSALAKASKVHRINNVSADIAFIGAFIEFDRARKQG